MKTKKYRNKAERIENAGGMKRGGNIELLRPISDCNMADLGLTLDYDPLNASELGKLTGMTVGDLCDKLGVKELYFKAATESEGMRDMSDVEVVMIEQNIVGTCFAYRRVGEKTRAMQSVCGFVEPKQETGEDEEEAARQTKYDVELRNQQQPFIDEEAE